MRKQRKKKEKSKRRRNKYKKQLQVNMRGFREKEREMTGKRSERKDYRSDDVRLQET